MPKKRFTDEQIALALRQAEAGTTVGEICRKMGIAEATFYRWKKVYAGMGVAEIRRLKQLEGPCQGNLGCRAVGRWLAFVHEQTQPFQVVQDEPRDHPPGGNDVCSLSAVAPRNVEDLLHERGIDVSHETVRFWWHRFGPMFAAEIRKRRIEGMRSSRLAVAP